MGLPTKIASHPIHPMLIPFPIALWIFSFACDVVFWLSPSGALGLSGIGWGEMAFYTMAGGIVGALIAAIFGLGDFLSLSNPATVRVARAHMVLNLVIVMLYLVNFASRVGTDHFPGLGLLLLSAVSLLLLGISGWLGGELVYVHGVAVKASTVPTPPSEKGKPAA